MKKLGLIGGTGPESTIEYYRQIEYGVQRRAGSLPPLAIESLSVFDVLRFCDDGDYAGLTEYLLAGFGNLARAGADFASLTGITPHIVFDEVAAASPIPLVSIMDAAAERAEREGLGRVALLGTYPTMSGSFFPKAFEDRGIDVVVPTEDEMRYIGAKIESELEYGRVVPDTQRRFRRIAGRLVRQEKAEAVVLGCTELPLILNDDLLPAPCLDVMRVHIDKLVSLILEG